MNGLIKKYFWLFVFSFLFLAGCGAADITVEAPLTIGSTGVDPAAWVQVPAGSFYEGPKLKEIIIENAYQIMVTDVTNAQYAEYLNQALADGFVEMTGDEILGYYAGDVFRAYEHEVEIAAGDWLHMPVNEAPSQIQYDGSAFTVLEGYENYPVVMVTWFGAKAYCEYNDGRLPSELEWEKAARGTDDRPFPWGHDLESNNANYYRSKDPFDRQYSGLGGTTPVGFYNGKTYAGYETLDSASPYGLYDMAGNVWQWTADIYPDTHMRTMRGGSKANYEPDLRIWARNSAGPDYYGPSVGFRCVRDMLE